MAALLSPAAIDSLIADTEASGMGLDGAQGLFSQMTKAVLERTLQLEMIDHLGYEKGDLAGHGSGNSRNGSTSKSVITNSGPVRLDVPRDRAGTFEPRIVPKRARRLGSVDDMILSLYSRGMTTRDIKEHLAEVYGADVSPGLISNVTDVVVDEITQWQTRPLDAVYPIMYIDAVVVKIREGGTVDNRAAHLAIGVDVDGFKHVLGIWVAENEGAKFWQNVLNELVNRGVADVLIVCCDGLTGLPDAIANVWPNAIVQTCVVHLIRASTRFVSQADRKAVVKGLRPIYEAVNEAAARQALNDLKHHWGQKYTGLISTWERSWEEFIPFLEFHPAIRKVIYTTNAIESMNYQLRKISKTRGHFPSPESAIKLLYLGIRNITGRHIDGEGSFAGKRGTGTYGWNRAYNAFATRFGDRLPL
ncbi:MAG: IS256 family transposase [Pseudonocardia sp.]|nr:IS256 family transposase [Pseudonocardia sp.]